MLTQREAIEKLEAMAADTALLTERPLSLGRLALPAGEEAVASGGEVGIAVRPEKVRLEPDQPPADRVALHGKVSEVAYYGENSFVFVTDDAGRSISVTLQNEARDTNASVSLGDELWCSWDPGDTLLLTR